MKTVRVVLIGLITAAALAAQSKIQKPPNSLPSVTQRPPIETSMPRITGASPDCGNASCSAITLAGRNFGAARGTRRIIFDGSPMSNYPHWSDTTITFMPGSNVTFWPVSHSFYLDDGAGQRVSNTFDIVFLYKFDGANPVEGAPGTEIQVSSWGCGPQSGKSLWMGTTPMTINFWPGGGYQYFVPIKAIVPPLAPGTYLITMRSGSQQVSKSSISFKVK